MIQTTEQIRRVIEQDAQEVTSKMLADLIKEHRQGESKRQKKLWDRYMLSDVPIYNREPANYEKVDRRTANDFFGDIVDTKVGYMGNEVTIGLDREEYKQSGELQEARFDRDRRFMRHFSRQNATEDLNSEVARDAFITGVGYRLLWSQNNEVRMMNLSPWEVIFIYDQSIEEPQLVLRYYEMDAKEFGGEIQHKKLTVVEWYDATEVRYYIDDGELNFELDTNRGDDGTQPHLFDGVPVIAFPNNGEMRAEPEKVTDLIDAYDAIISSTTSEIEQLRLAYMYAKGVGMRIDDEFVKRLEQTGIFPLEEDGEVGFVNKQISDAPVQNILAEIRRNIYQFAKSIDMSKDFGGDMRVIGWKVALLNLENSSKITERKFTKALRQQYQLITDYWRTFQQMDIDPMSLEFTFTRNFPHDVKAEAEILQMLKGNVSNKTALAQMSFIDDPEEELAQMEQEEDVFGIPDVEEESADAGSESE